MLQAVEYAAQGHDTGPCRETSIAALRTASAKHLAQAIMQSDPHGWWEAFACAGLKEALDRHCRAFVAGYKVPKRIELRTEPLPKSGPGKVLKCALRAPYWEGHEITIA